ncbi:hypothetical protein [Streptomyces sp. NPDC127084]|uniref:hypothetical protein n=1 Tax=Streptomyces sp. NPDC127084 TaxID=3347133 RepID=UPI00365A5304
MSETTTLRELLAKAVELDGELVEPVEIPEFNGRELDSDLAGRRIVELMYRPTAGSFSPSFH